MIKVILLQLAITRGARMPTIKLSPQFQILNNDIWRTLEDVCRDKIKEDEEKKICNVHVYTGPVTENGSGSESSEDKLWGKSKKKKISDDHSENAKAVPIWFFKVIIVENYNGTVEEPVCYLIPNDTSYLEEDRAVQEDVGKTTMINKEILDTYESSLEEI